MDLFILPSEEACEALRDIDIAGTRFGELLAAQAAAHFTVCSPDEPAATAADALYVRSDAWFSTQALARLVDRLAAAPAQPASLVCAGRDILAAHLPASQASLLGVPAGAGSAAGLQRLPQQLPQHAKVDAAALDPDFPPFRIVDLFDVASIEKRLSLERARALMTSGVRIRDPERIVIRGKLECGARVELDVDVIIEGHVRLGDGVRVGPHCILKSARIGDRSRINAFSIVEESSIGADSFVGPFGRVRPGSALGDRAQVGNFVEIKNARVGIGARINHLAFVGDAVLGNDVTLGAGVITCNHDGKGVNTTRIEDGAYVGSGCELVAPISIGAGALIAAGSTVTQDAPAGMLTIARARQATVARQARDDPGSPEA